MESTADGGFGFKARMSLQIVESTPKHSDKLEIALNALGCLGEVDQLGGMNMRKSFWLLGSQASNAWHCLDKSEP